MNEVVEKIANTLKEKGLTIATAESCTAGCVATTLSDIEGASQYLKGGIVTYTNEIKERILGVNKAKIEYYDVVSEQVATEMAVNIRKLFNTDVGVGVTGYIGQTGGNEKVPNGTVWICVDKASGCITKKLFITGGSRVQKKMNVVGTVINLISEALEITN